MGEIFLAGDVMTGRGVDQILPHPSAPELFESHIRDARDYITIAEEVNGPIARPAPFDYVWGDVLDDVRRAAVRIVNLETSITRCDDYWPGKGINYRMHPENVPCLTAANLDVCVLANNHVLDWGRRGLVETLETLKAAGLKTAGAGRTSSEADALAIVDIAGGGRVLVAALTEPSSGVPAAWRAKEESPGVAFVRQLDEASADAIGARIQRVRRPGDVVIVSIHWGSNWGYEVDARHVRFAHALVDRGVDLVHGHSSHHPRPIEFYRGKPILYGCGDLVSDYEGITGYEPFRTDLVLAYFAGGRALRIKPLRLRKLRLERASREDTDWLGRTLARISRPYGTTVEIDGNDLIATPSAA